MDTMPILGYLGALSVGIILGLMGGGGSIITIPILTYFFYMSPVTTTAYSLFIVGTSALIGSINNLKKGYIMYRIAIVFAIPSMIYVYIVRKYLLPIIPIEIVNIQGFILTKDRSIMVFFAIVMLLASISMIKKRKKYPKTLISNNYNYIAILLAGLGIGFLTGIVGIGGGFIIIPTLVVLVKLPMKRAIATSLAIIAIKSLIGFIGDLANIYIDWEFLLQFTFISILGIFLGNYFLSFINEKKLKKYFGWMILFVSFGILYKELFF
tara:strand:+ start:63491 stop:64291 length:801 start_codon:yes stop_codon:yes gene_type:complete